jgi:hypothetical protein
VEVVNCTELDEEDETPPLLAVPDDDVDTTPLLDDDPDGDLVEVTIELLLEKGGITVPVDEDVGNPDGLVKLVERMTELVFVD